MAFYHSCLKVGHTGSNVLTHTHKLPCQTTFVWSVFPCTRLLFVSNTKSGIVTVVMKVPEMLRNKEMNKVWPGKFDAPQQLFQWL